MDAGNLLKPLLARGELRCVGATTLDEYRQYIEKAQMLCRFSKGTHLNVGTLRQLLQCCLHRILLWSDAFSKFWCRSALAKWGIWGSWTGARNENRQVQSSPCLGFSWYTMHFHCISQAKSARCHLHLTRTDGKHCLRKTVLVSVGMFHELHLDCFLFHDCIWILSESWIAYIWLILIVSYYIMINHDYYRTVHNIHIIHHVSCLQGWSLATSCTTVCASPTGPWCPCLHVGWFRQGQ